MKALLLTSLASNSIKSEIFRGSVKAGIGSLGTVTLGSGVSVCSDKVPQIIRMVWFGVSGG